MKIKYAQYEHTCIGFPKVILNWHYNHQRGYSSAYVTVKDIIRPWRWASQENIHASQELEAEIKRFDEWVRLTYSEDSSVQG